MSATDSEIMEAIRTAMQLEKDGRAFFIEAAQKTKNAMGKRVFEALAEDEVGHMKVLDKIADAVTAGTDWRHLAPDRPPAERAMIFVKEDTAKSPRAGDETEVAVLEEAMRLEKKAIDFFTEASEKAGDAAAREIFRSISQEEVHHYDLLQAELDSVTNSGFWFDIQEFKLDGLY